MKSRSNSCSYYRQGLTITDKAPLNRGTAPSDWLQSSHAEPPCRLSHQTGIFPDLGLATPALMGPISALIRRGFYARLVAVQLAQCSCAQPQMLPEGRRNGWFTSANFHPNGTASDLCWRMTLSPARTHSSLAPINNTHAHPYTLYIRSTSSGRLCACLGIVMEKRIHANINKVTFRRWV